MRSSSSEGSKERDPSDTISQARIQHLLRGANSAAALRHQFALLGAEAAHRLTLYRLHFNPDQPRVPAGHPDGGQWMNAVT